MPLCGVTFNLSVKDNKLSISGSKNKQFLQNFNGSYSNLTHSLREYMNAVTFYKFESTHCVSDFFFCEKDKLKK